jgi:hypothetical protein
MKVINPIVLARQALVPSSAEREEEQRVLQLFRNRAELKKAYTELQDEIHRLKDRLKQQEGATARVQEQLATSSRGSLRRRRPTRRSCSTSCAACGARAPSCCARSARDLEKQQVERERRAFLAETNRDQFERRQQAEAALRAAEIESAEAGQQVHAPRARAARVEPALAPLQASRDGRARRGRGVAADAVRVAPRAGAQRLRRGDRRGRGAVPRAEPRGAPGDQPRDRRLCRAAVPAAAADAAAAARPGRGAASRPVRRVRRSRRLRGADGGDRARQGAAAAAHRRDGGAACAQRTPAQGGALSRRGRRDPGAGVGGGLGRRRAGACAAGPRAPQMPNVLAEDTWDVFRILLR